MTRLPVIVGFGGINAAGRASFDHAYHRLVVETLDTPSRDATYRNLATLMNIAGDPKDPETRRFIDTHTLIRRIEHFSLDEVLVHKSAMIAPVPGHPYAFTVPKRQLPEHLPGHWQVEDADERTARVTTSEPFSVLFPDLSLIHI